MSVDPPLRCAVLVEADAAVSAPLIGQWQLLFANCDVAAARETAAEWSRNNLGKRAIVMVFDDMAVSKVSTDWVKP
jgi:hypothetical protein